MRNVSDINVVGKKTHYVQKPFFFSEKYAVYVIIWKNMYSQIGHR
jgi:hypothetical protein